MTPREVEERHTSRELDGWLVYDRVFGIPDPKRDDARAGQIAAQLWNTAQGGIATDHAGKNRRPAEPKDFFARLAEEPASVEVDDDDGFDDDMVGEGPDPVKNYWAFWGLVQRETARKAEQLDVGTPPQDPEEN